MSGCSTCDDYTFVPGPDGRLLVRCPDCVVAVAVVRCPVHGRQVVKGKCPSCRREVTVAEELFAIARALVVAAVVPA